MSTFVDAKAATAENVAHIPATLRAPSRRRFGSAVSDQPAKGSPKGALLLTSILTTSACLHFLLIGLLGYGTPKPTPRPRAPRPEAPLPAIVENIQLDAPPPPPPAKETPTEQELVSPDPTNVPAPVAAIAAVAATVPVDFAIKVAGPVHLVANASQASGGGLPVPVAVPREVVGRNLLTPELTYPPVARYKHLTGRVVVEFRTTSTGDIVDVKIHSGSGHDELDQAALENLRLGRWVGEAGYFTKTYEFILR